MISFRVESYCMDNSTKNLIDFICFQQNEEVIRYVTIPNAVLNLADSSSLVIDKEGTIDCKFSDASVKQVAERVSFFSGDWSDLERKLTPNIHENSHKFDVILTSETIYNTDCYEKLLHVMTSCLKSNGIMYPFRALHNLFHWVSVYKSRLFHFSVRMSDYLEYHNKSLAHFICETLKSGSYVL